MKKYYPSVRTLHLYFGLFISPFVLIFSVSVLVLNHTSSADRINPVKKLTDIKTRIDKIPYDTSDLKTAQAIIHELGIEGEIDFISKNDGHISFPVTKPGLKTTVDVNTLTNDVIITKQIEGSLRAANYLHKMPGPHNENLRGNSAFLKVWRVFADVVVYVLLFLSASGIFLWYFLKVERKMGWYAIILGVISFIGLLILIL